MQNRYLEYFNDSPTLFIKFKGNSSKVEYITNNVTTLLGYTLEEVLDSNFSFENIIHKGDYKLIKDEIKELEFSNEIELSPYRVLTKNSNYIWIKEIRKKFYDNKINENHICSYISNITKEVNLKKNLFYTNKIIKTVYDNSVHLIALLKPNGTLIKANKTALEFINKDEKEIINKKFWDTNWWDESQKQIIKKDLKKASKGFLVHSEKKVLDEYYIELTIKPVYDENRVIYLVCEGKDITQAKKKEKKINHYNEIINKQLISITNKEGIIKECSDAFCELTGYDKNELVGKKHNILKHPNNNNNNNNDDKYKDLWETITLNRTWKGKLKNKTKDGRSFWVENTITPNCDENGNIESYTAIYNNITTNKKIKEKLITDELTGIYNRRYFNKIFKKYYKKFQKYNEKFVLMIVDIDYFKQYNDNYGHSKGDEVLKDVAQTLKLNLRKCDYVFRIGGEEFAILVAINRHNVSKIIANKLKEAIYNLNIIHEFSFYRRLTISVGIKQINEKLLLKNKIEIFNEADKALYKAKQNGRNRVFTFFDT
ncbi:hypothetical protein CPG38_13455 [Malaciobacter marinus]|uniref:diguanylate cyclase n=1 Tax=Malaciobacter marinus TaxID=505249 RepID=UPI000C07EF7C|nr:diguanylate cyclase [Malaciobacter marinus]PHO11373.1 hypothetical protein CPG38_13455 [Malaciobacter marinus]